MKDVHKLINTCLSEVTSIGIKPSKNITWSINSRAKSRWGLCKKTGPFAFEIQIAECLLTDDRISETNCKETIIHEILHTCPKCMNHTGKWKEYAALLNEAYGYNIKRVKSTAEMGVEKREVKRQPVKYAFECKKCGQRIERKKECKFTKYYKSYGCGICGCKKAFIKVV